MLRQWLSQTFPSLAPYSQHIIITFFAVGFVLILLLMNWSRPKKP